MAANRAIMQNCTFLNTRYFIKLNYKRWLFELKIFPLRVKLSATFTLFKFYQSCNCPENSIVSSSVSWRQLQWISDDKINHHPMVLLMNQTAMGEILVSRRRKQDTNNKLQNFFSFFFLRSRCWQIRLMRWTRWDMGQRMGVQYSHGRGVTVPWKRSCSGPQSRRKLSAGWSPV